MEKGEEGGKGEGRRRREGEREMGLTLTKPKILTTFLELCINY